MVYTFALFSLRHRVLQCNTRLELPLDLVKFDSTGMPAYPNSPGKIDGGVTKQINLHHHIPTGLPSYLQTYYIPSAVEYKFKDDMFMRQAILASASLQGINRSLRLKGAVNYAFSIDGRKGEVDVIISTWTEDNNVSPVSLNLMHCHSSVGLGLPLSLQNPPLVFQHRHSGPTAQPS